MFITNILSQFIDINNVIFKSLASNKIALYIKSYNDFKKIFHILKHNNIEFHCKAPKQDKVLSWLLKGISDHLEEEDVLREINNLKFKNLNILSIKKIDTKIFFKR